MIGLRKDPNPRMDIHATTNSLTLKLFPLWAAKHSNDNQPIYLEDEEYNPNRKIQVPKIKR